MEVVVLCSYIERTAVGVAAAVAAAVVAAVAAAALVVEPAYGWIELAHDADEGILVTTFSAFSLEEQGR